MPSPSYYARALMMFAMVITVAGCATTSILVGTPRPPISPDEVKLYLEPPARFEEIAVLDANNRNSFAFTDQQRMDVAIGRLKAEAAKYGANGILFQGAGDRYTGSIGAATTSFTRRGAFGLASAIPLYIKEARGIGIYVEPDIASMRSPPPIPAATDARAPAQSASPPLIAQAMPTSTAQPAPSKRVVGATFGDSPDGLVVLSVEKRGVAARAGLKAGDLITHIDGRHIAAIYWEYSAERLTNSGDTVNIRVRGKGERTLSFAE